MQPPVQRWGLPDLGFGVGLRGPHIPILLRDQPPIDWLEIISDNLLIHQGWLRDVARRLRQRYPMVLHGVGLGVGGGQPLDRTYLLQLKQLADDLQVAWVSDHLAWTALAGRRGSVLHSHDLLPVPYTRGMLAWVVARIRQVQELLERPLVLENPSTYLQFRQSTVAEWDFVAELAERADCGLLLDVNNIYVSSRNHHWDAARWLDAVPWSRVCQIHIAGPRDRGSHLLDTHEGPVPAAVWELYAAARQRGGARATLLEWDAQLPPFADLLVEVERARAVARRADGPGPARAPVAEEPPAAASPSAPSPRLPRQVAQAYRKMFAAVTGHGEPPAEAAAAAHVATLLRSQPPLQARQRVAIYRDMYRIRLAEALSEDFPRLRAALGPLRWRRLVRSCIAVEPSRHAALEAYSGVFAQFVAREGGAQHLPHWAAALAAIEWSRCRAWLAPADPPLDMVRLQAALADPSCPLRLRLCRATQLERTGLAAWLRAGGAPPRARPRGPFSVRISRTAQFERREAVLHPAEAWLLLALGEGQSLQEALGTLGQRAPRALPLVGGWLQAWAADGVVTLA